MKTFKVIIPVLIPVFVLLSPLVSVSQCVLPFEGGSWTNNDVNTRGIVNLRISVSCNDNQLCGIDANGNEHCQPPAPPYQIQIWGKCTPSNCDWGVANGNDWYASDGTKWIYFYYDQGFAKRYVFVKPSTLHPGNLFLWMYTDFVSTSRTDYVFTGWYHH